MLRIKRVILALVIVFVILTTVFAILFAVLYNTTFDKMGFSDKPILNGKSIADMKLSSYTPKDLMPLAKSLFKDNSSLVKYAPDGSDRQALDDCFNKSDIVTLTEIRYSRLIYRSAEFYNPRLLLLTDKQLSALLNNVVNQAPSDILLATSAEVLEYLGVKAIKDVLNCLDEYDVTVEQIELTNGNVPHMQMLLSMDISKHTDGVKVPFFGKLSSKVYVALDYDVNVTTDGEIDLRYVSLSVNGKDSELSEKVLDGLFIALSNSDNPMTTQALAKGVAAFVAVVFEHVGRIGNGTVFGLTGVDGANKTICFVAA
ncbi:MAG: hypothetical protein J1G02_01315 [Clostridiales bacterium]|nr:hypothetical protein [Clostridiales bacterium]